MATDGNEAEEHAPDLLRAAQAEHSAGRIDAALGLARRAIDIDLGFADAWVYLGTTLITRKLSFFEGLAALDEALALAPTDAGVNYSAGWCYEFVAHRLARQPAAGLDARELFERAAGYLRRCIELEPEPGLKEDAEDLLEAIENRR